MSFSQQASALLLREPPQVSRVESSPVSQSFNAAKDKLASLQSQLANATGDAAAALNAKIAAAQTDVNNWRTEIATIQQNAGLAPVPAPPAAAAFNTADSSPGGGGGGGTVLTPTSAASPLAGMSPQLIIGLALTAAVGGGIWLATRKKKGK